MWDCYCSLWYLYVWVVAFPVESLSRGTAPCLGCSNLLWIYWSYQISREHTSTVDIWCLIFPVVFIFIFWEQHRQFWSLHGSSKHYLGYSCEYLHGAAIAHWMLHFSPLNGTYSNIAFWGVCPHALQLYCHWVMMIRIAALSDILPLPTAVGLYCLCVTLWDLSFLPLCQHLRLELLATAVYAADSAYVNQESLHTWAVICPLFAAYHCTWIRVRILHQTYTPEAG